jgi:hypothetical protein
MLQMKTMVIEPRICEALFVWAAFVTASCPHQALVECLQWVIRDWDEASNSSRYVGYALKAEVKSGCWDLGWNLWVTFAFSPQAPTTSAQPPPVRKF